MFHGGKPKIVAALIMMLGICLGSTGCLGSPGQCGQNGCGTGCDSCNTGKNPDPTAPANKPGGSGFLPSNVQKVSYLGDDAHGQPLVGQAAIPAGAAGENGIGPIPTEINKVSLPPYRVAPPDILYIDAIRLVPKPPYRIDSLEVLSIQVTDTLPNQPINGPFVVTPEGKVNLGYGYGSVAVQGLTTEQVEASIRQHLSKILRNPQVSVTLAQFRGQQQVHGEHLVRQDGTISLGAYGSVHVAGKTLGEVKQIVENHLKQYVVNPQVAVDVFSYNSTWYYVIFDGGGYGELIYRLPITGNETVLDAISNLQGLPPVSSLWRIWVARPAPPGHPCDQILMVNWQAVVKGGSTATNYQLFPGDRVYVDADCLIKTDLWLAKILAPVERVLGITLLGSATVNSIKNGGITSQNVNVVK
ncbi:MAG TPA: polysaccharide biosynthesis/export family protein [Gemmataceae bacterium]|nr:polysaccharide biosynthesis/export family protein [Gemmataceae bacterium]